MQTENPWTILGEKEYYQNNWIKITEYQVLNPAKNPGIYGKVHFKNLAIGIIVLDDDHNTYLIGQYRFPLNSYSWEIPEGGSPLNDNPLEGARRELLEEAGLVAKKWTKIQTIHLSNSVTDEYGIVYLAQDLEQHTPCPEDTEQLVIKKLPFNSVYEMVENGEITDSLSVAAILKVKLMLADGRIF